MDAAKVAMPLPNILSNHRYNRSNSLRSSRNTTICRVCHRPLCPDLPLHLTDPALVRREPSSMLSLMGCQMLLSILETLSTKSSRKTSDWAMHGWRSLKWHMRETIRVHMKWRWRRLMISICCGWSCKRGLYPPMSLTLWVSKFSRNSTASWIAAYFWSYKLSGSTTRGRQDCSSLCQPMSRRTIWAHCIIWATQKTQILWRTTCVKEPLRCMSCLRIRPREGTRSTEAKVILEKKLS